MTRSAQTLDPGNGAMADPNLKILEAQNRHREAVVELLDRAGSSQDTQERIDLVIGALRAMLKGL